MVRSRRYWALAGSTLAAAALMAGTALAPATAAGDAATPLGTRPPVGALPPSACVVSGYSPTRVTGGINAEYRDFTPIVTGCTLGAWAIDIKPFDAGFPVGDPDEFREWSYEGHPAYLNPRVLTDSDIGRHVGQVQVYALAEGESESTTAPGTGAFDISILKPSLIPDLQAEPRFVRAGATITITGTLTRVRWNGAKHLKYIPYKQIVTLQTRHPDDPAYTTVKTLKTDSLGRIKTTVKISSSTRYRFHFDGISTTLPTTSDSDLVTVR